MKGAWREIMNGSTTLYYYRFTKGAWREIINKFTTLYYRFTQTDLLQIHEGCMEGDDLA